MFIYSRNEHKNNLANFYLLIILCEAFKSKYNPSSEHLRVTSLYKTYHTGKNLINNESNFRARLIIAKSERQNTFSDLELLCSKIIDNLIIYIDNDEVLRCVKAYNEQIKTLLKSDNNNIEIRYNNLIAHFGNLINIIEKIPEYSPYHTTIKKASLKKKFQNMVKHCLQHTKAMTEHSSSILEINHFFYKKKEGVIGVANDIKQYIKNAFGTNSNEFNQINRLKFTCPTLV